MSLNPSEVKFEYSNEAVARFNGVMAKEATAIFGRATGKTLGLHGERLFQNALEMPRSLTGILVINYRWLMEFYLMPLVKYFENHGMEQGKHYFLRSKAPENWGWDMPYNRVFDYSHFLHLPNGSGAIMLSMDANSTNNGASVDAMMIDEVRKINKQRLAEAIPTKGRGNAYRFRHSPLYDGVLYTTDMPDVDDEPWVLDHKNHMDYTQIQLIEYFNTLRAVYYSKWIKTDSADAEKRFRQADAEWRLARRKSCFYMEADSFANRHVLLPDWYESQFKNPDQRSVGPQIFTLKPQLGVQSFFPTLKKKTHTYQATNRSFLEGMEWNTTTLKPNSKWDSDVVPDVPLQLVFDHNAGINCLIVIQEYGGRCRVVKAFYVKDTENKRLNDLCAAFAEYYRFHPNHDVDYLYDSTDVKKDNRQLGSSMEDVVKYLTNEGYNVTPIYTGVPSNHVDRYRFMKKYLAGEYTHLPAFEINIDNAEPVYESMKRTNVKQRTSGEQAFGIDKSNETDALYPQEYATHFPEAICKFTMHRYALNADRPRSVLASL